MKEYKYYIRTTADNAVVVMPSPGQKFSESDKAEMIETLRAKVSDTVVREKGVGISVIFMKFSNVCDMNLDDLIENALPKMQTKAKMSADAKSAALAKKREVIEQEQKQIINGSDHAAKWASEHFSDAMNNYNMAALIKYLAGETSAFNGLVNANACDVMVKLGAANVEENGYKLNWQELKSQCERAAA